MAIAIDNRVVLNGDEVELLECLNSLKDDMTKQIILNTIDPFIPFGNPFEFEDRPDDEFYVSAEVPGIGAQVDLAEAWRISKLDAAAVKLTLEYDHSLEATLLTGARMTKMKSDNWDTIPRNVKQAR